jgi:hypothetical protein
MPGGGRGEVVSGGFMRCDRSVSESVWVQREVNALMISLNKPGVGLDVAKWLLFECGLDPTDLDEVGDT